MIRERVAGYVFRGFLAALLVDAATTAASPWWAAAWAVLAVALVVELIRRERRDIRSGAIRPSVRDLAATAMPAHPLDVDPTPPERVAGDLEAIAGDLGRAYLDAVRGDPSAASELDYGRIAIQRVAADLRRQR